MAALPEMLTTSCVTLRRCRLDDLDALMAAIEVSQPELARFLPWANPLPTRDAEAAVLERMTAEFDADVAYAYLLTEPGTGEIVGGAGLQARGEGTIEIGYWVRSDRTGNGYATCAAEALTDAAFRYLPDVEAVIIRTDKKNIASAAIPPKLGYTLTGEAELPTGTTTVDSGEAWVWSRPRSAGKAGL